MTTVKAAYTGGVLKINARAAIVKSARAKCSIDELLGRAARSGGGNHFVQLFDADSIIDTTHVLAAYVNAVGTFYEHTNIAKTCAMEMMLFAAMTTQISDAIMMVGAKDRDRLVVFATDNTALGSISGLMFNMRDFAPTEGHAKAAAMKFGIIAKGGRDALIMQEMALSRLR